MKNMTAKCSKCGEPHSRYRDGSKTQLASYCAPCHAAYRREWRKKVKIEQAEREMLYADAQRELAKLKKQVAKLKKQVDDLNELAAHYREQLAQVHPPSKRIQ